MNKIFYSKTHGFFDDTMPQHVFDTIEDAVEITREEYDSLFEGQASGMRIVADANGKPINVAYEITEEQVRETRDILLAKSDWTMMSDSPLSEEQKSAWMVYRQALRDIPQQVGFPQQVTFPKAP